MATARLVIIALAVSFLTGACIAIYETISADDAKYQWRKGWGCISLWPKRATLMHNSNLA